MAELSNFADSNLLGVGNQCLSKATLAINAASAATFKTTGITTFVLNGIFYTKAALSAQAFTAPTGYTLPTTVAASANQQFVVCLDSSGNVTTYWGLPYYSTTIGGNTVYVNDLTNPTRIETYNSAFLPGAQAFAGPPAAPLAATAAATNASAPIVLAPAIPATVVPIGIIVIKRTASGTFTLGTTALDDSTTLTGSAATYYDISHLPQNVNL